MSAVIPRCSDLRVEGIAIVSIGVVLLSAALGYQFFWGASSVDPYARGFELALIAFMSVALAYGGLWISRQPRKPNSDFEIVVWSVLFAFALTSLASGMFMIQYRLGVMLEDVGLILLIAASTGAAVGTLIGIKHTALQSQVDRIKLHQESLLLLNRLIRHHILNAMQAIQIYAHHMADRLGDTDHEELDVIDKQSQRIVTLASNVRLVCETISGDRPIHPVSVESLLTNLEVSIEEQYGECNLELGRAEVSEIEANDSLRIGLELLLGKLVGIQVNTFTVDVTSSPDRNRAIIQITPDGRKLSKSFFRSRSDSNPVDPRDLEMSILQALLRTFDGELSLNNDSGTCIELSLRQVDGATPPGPT